MAERKNFLHLVSNSQANKQKNNVSHIIPNNVVEYEGTFCEKCLLGVSFLLRVYLSTCVPFISEMYFNLILAHCKICIYSEKFLKLNFIIFMTILLYWINNIIPLGRIKGKTLPERKRIV